MALTCHGTFDVDPHHLPDLLERDEDIAVVTECSIIIHDRCPVVVEDQAASINPLLHRYRRLSCVLEPLLRQRILEVCNGLDRTIGRLWAGYVSGSPWTALETPSERWLITETSSGCGLSSMLVHYNLLDGSLLVNGSPLTRLPHSYESHPTFRRLFGEVKYSIRNSVGRRANRLMAETASCRCCPVNYEWDGFRGSECILRPPSKYPPLPFSFPSFLYTELWNDRAACDANEHHHSCTLACTTPSSSSGQEDKDRSMNCSQYTHSPATSQSRLFMITRIGYTLRRASLNGDRYPVLGH